MSNLIKIAGAALTIVALIGPWPAAGAASSQPAERVLIVNGLNISIVKTIAEKVRGKGHLLFDP